MRVVHVGAVSVLVRLLVVDVKVAVLPDDRRVVRVIVVAVAVTVRVLVRDPRVRMTMLVPLGRVKVDAGTEQDPCNHGGESSSALSQGPRRGRADERRQREQGTRSCSPDATLGKQIEAKAQAVSDRTTGQKSERMERGPEALPQRHGHDQSDEESQSALGPDHLDGIEIREGSGQGIVERPAQRRCNHCGGSPRDSAMTAVVQRAGRQHQNGPAGRRERERPQHARTERLAVQSPCDERGEDGFEVQEQRRARSADALEPPGKGGRRQRASEQRDDEKTARVLRTNRGLTPPRPQ